MTPTDIATSFLKDVTDGNITEAYDKYIDTSGQHHNLTTPAGMAALKHGMAEADRQFKQMTYTVKFTIEDKDLVAVYGLLTMKTEKATLQMATVHTCRIKNQRIVELWDSAQQVPDPPVNTDGAY